MIEKLPTIEEIIAKDQILTLQAATGLNGKSICCYSADEPGMRKIFVVGQVHTAYELAATQFCSDLRFANMQKYFDACLSPESVEFQKNKYILLSANGEATYVAHTGKWDIYQTPRFVSRDPSYQVLYLAL